LPDHGGGDGGHRLHQREGMGAPHVCRRQESRGQKLSSPADVPGGRAAPSTFLVAVPTGIKIFNWLGTMWGGKIRFTTPMLFCVAFLFQFLCAGLTGVMLGLAPFNWPLTDSYFVVAHFHYVLVGAILFNIFAAIYYWFPKATGRLLSERLGHWHFWLLVIGFNLTFGPLHIAGVLGMPRRIYTYQAGRGWE